MANVQLTDTGNYTVTVTNSAGTTLSDNAAVTVNSAATVPANNTFANAAAITGLPAQVSGTNALATAETGEPNPTGLANGNSVWWQWVAQNSGPIAVTTAGSNFNTVLAVYTGSSLATLTVVGANVSSAGGPTSAVIINAVAGTTYYIEVDGKQGATATTGSITLNLRAANPPANDNLANATPITGISGSATVPTSFTGTNVDATKEPGEPNHAGDTGGASVWWTWAAPSTGVVSLDTSGSNLNALLAVYTGSAVNALTSVASNAGSGGNGTSALTFNAVSGTTYRIAVDGKQGAMGSIKLNLLLKSPPINDNLANATVITGANPPNASGTNLYSTIEATDPASIAGSAPVGTVWWQWVATGSGPVAVNTNGSAFDTVLGIYNAPVSSTSAAVASDDNSGSSGASALTFTAVSGTTYYIVVAGKQGAAVGNGSISLSLIGQFSPPGGGPTPPTTPPPPTTPTSPTPVSGPAPFLYPASVARDNSGNLYVADASSNSILKITSAGAISTFASSLNQPAGVAVDNGGNVYVADTGNGVIRKITPVGAVTTLAGSPGTRGNLDGTGNSALFGSPAGVAVDSAGNVYVADAYSNTIRKVTSSGIVTTIAGSAAARGDSDGVGTGALFNFPMGVAVDSAGNIFVADAFNSTIRKITASGTVTTIAGSAGIIGSNDGTGINALFNLPLGVAVDSAGNVYVADAGNATIRKIAPGGTVTTVAGMAETAGLKDASGTSAMFNQPSALVVDASGTIYVADAGNGFLRKVTSGGAVSTPTLTGGPISASAGAGGSVGSGISTLPSSFQYVASVARDNSGNLYAADSANDIIVKVTSAGSASILAGSVGAAGSQDGSGTGASFNRPAGIAVDGGGNVYVADSGNSVIRKVTSSGVVSTLAGTPGSPGASDGAGGAAQFSNPTGVAVDTSGNVYVADSYNNSIRKVTSAGSVTTLAGSTTRGDADGTGSAAQFDYPTGVAVDGSGTVYVADAYNATIRRVNSAGAVTTLAGSAGIMGSNNGTGTNALFNLPMAVTADNSGNVYVADSGNAMIRKIASGGTVTTVAGVAGIAGYRDAAGSSALFDQPRGIATDGAGTIWVADTGNGLIRKIGSDGTVATPSVQAASTPTGPTGGSGGGSVDTTTPPPTGGGGSTPSSGGGGGGGGGGGAMDPWLVGLLAMLGFARWAKRRQTALG